MTSKKTTLILAIVVAVILFISQCTSYGNIFQLLLPDNARGRLIATTMGGHFQVTLFFAAVVALMPILLCLTWFLARIETTKGRLTSAFIVLLFSVSALALKRKLVKSGIEYLISIETNSQGTVSASIPIDKLHYDYYLLGGILVGCIVSFFALKGK
jgi:hypothetical protein